MYSTTDYLLAAWVVVPLTLWLLIEFLGFLRAVTGFLAKKSSQAPASAQEAAQRVSEAPLYAAARNARQRRQ